MGEKEAWVQQSCLTYYELAAKFTSPNNVHEMVNSLPNP